MARQTLESWIQEALAEPEREPVSMISLIHMTGTAEKEIYSRLYKGKTIPAAGELAKLFRGRAESYSQELPGVQTFVLLVFYGDVAQGEPLRHPFVLTGALDFQGGLVTEAPTEIGSRQQGMRLTEAIVQRTFGQIGVVFDHTARLLDRADKRIAMLEEENRDAFVIVKEVLMEKQLADHTRAMKEMEFQRQTGERAMWMKYLPALANQLLGREIFPQNVEDTALVETIADHVSDDEFNMLTKLLPPVISGPLSARMARYLKEKRLATEEVKRLSAIHANGKDPETDAAGD